MLRHRLCAVITLVNSLFCLRYEQDWNFRLTESVSPVYHPSPPFDGSEHANLKAQLIANQNLVRALQDENSALKQQCDFLTVKAGRLQQVFFSLVKFLHVLTLKFNSSFRLYDL